MIEIRLVSQPQALTELQGEQLVELHLDYLANQRELLKEVKPGPVIQITPRLLLENNVIAAAFDSDKIIGYVLFRNITGALSIRCIFVNPAYRQKGLMKAMLDVVHAHETYHQIGVNLPPECDNVANYFEDMGYPKVRDLNCGWTCFSRVFAESSRRPTVDRPALSEVFGTCALK